MTTVPCRYFVQGWCRSGDECPFDHDSRILVTSAVLAFRHGATGLGNLFGDGFDSESTAVQSSQSPPDFSTAEFPSLSVAGRGSSSANKTGTVVAPAAETPVPWQPALQASAIYSLADKLKLQKLKAMFPTLDETSIGSHFQRCGTALEATRVSISLAFPGSEVALFVVFSCKLCLGVHFFGVWALL
jgi:hypothetical protein